MVGHAFAQENQVLANAPDLKVGDRWEYVRKEAFTGNEMGRYTLEVEKIDGEKVWFKRSTSNLDVSTFQTSTSGSNKFDRDGVTYNFQPLVFPLLTDSTWDSSFRDVNASGQPIRNHSEWHVVGTEVVSTPAGTFNTIRIEGTGYWQNMDPQYRRIRAGITETAWYAPAIKRIVKYRYTSQAAAGGSPNGSEVELVNFSLK